MLIESFIIFISAIVNLNSSSGETANHTSATTTVVTSSGVPVPPVAGKIKRGGWDGN